MADAGISVTPCNVFTSSRVFTNWLGKSASFLLSKSARAFYRPGRGVNLVVERQQLPAGNFRLRSAIKGIDGELSLPAQSSFNRAQAVFRYGENYGDGLQLRNDGEGYGSGRLHHVARIHQP